MKKLAEKILIELLRAYSTKSWANSGMTKVAEDKKMDVYEWMSKEAWELAGAFEQTQNNVRAKS